MSRSSELIKKFADAISLTPEEIEQFAEDNNVSLGEAAQMLKRNKQVNASHERRRHQHKNNTGIIDNAVRKFLRNRK